LGFDNVYLGAAGFHDLPVILQGSKFQGSGFEVWGSEFKFKVKEKSGGFSAPPCQDFVTAGCTVQEEALSKRKGGHPSPFMRRGPGLISFFHADKGVLLAENRLFRGYA
jgi:hypothetical protein